MNKCEMLALVLYAKKELIIFLIFSLFKNQHLFKQKTNKARK